MAPHLTDRIPPHLLMWQRVREYAVPPSMIETATARRAAGDWAGACAAARTDVDLDLRAVRDRQGTDTASRVRADLRRLAPDLLRWHMPRIAPDGRRRPGLTLTLARYGGSAGTSLHLVVRTPPAWADAGQRMSLTLWENSVDGAAAHRSRPHPDRRFRLDLHRHLWDAGRSGELAARCGAGDSSYGAADAAGYEPAPAGRRRHSSGRLDQEPTGAHHSSWALTRWAAEAELLLSAEGRSRGAFTVRLAARRRAVDEEDPEYVPDAPPSWARVVTVG